MSAGPAAVGRNATIVVPDASGKMRVLRAGTAFYAAYPSGANPDTSVPYAMWAGSPYQHLMSSVK
jgi:hypothetical protein